jgi:uncharacterized Zn finger protein
VPVRWRRVAAAALHRWAGGRWLAVGRAIATSGRARDLMRTNAGVVFGTVTDTQEARDYFAGVVMAVSGKKRLAHRIDSVCSCEPAPCLHAVAASRSQPGLATR